MILPDQIYSPMRPQQRSLVNRTIWAVALLVVLFCALLASLYAYVIRPPSSLDAFARGPAVVTVESGQSAMGIARELKQLGLVRSARAAQSLIILRGGERSIQAGIYMFDAPQDIFTVAERVTRGDFGYTAVKLTVPEGTSSKKLAELVAEKFPHIDQAAFELLAKQKEGYLFPETYFFAPIATSDMIIAQMSKTFESEAKKLQEDILKSGRTLSEIIIMASILEGEVQTEEDRRMVADLLYRRIAAGMPLQVDTTLAYVTGKTSAELTTADLRLDDPFNTYVNKGMPPTPISNPGLDTIKAVLDPLPNPYVFYLSDKDGITRFSITHDEHVRAKNKYLR